ncbi:hypothetical protein VP01_276g10 [Puccinia sorghi]|uniref:beta-N-acetylhexosaminidase n=1 Tax=Puccinia sorghi TaxID=27349 RepID=A0A0L6V4L4_9BASI|nr:hypothetical protein VP01_276g10 [Puccinia sorghi]
METAGDSTQSEVDSITDATWRMEEQAGEKEEAKKKKKKKKKEKQSTTKTTTDSESKEDDEDDWPSIRLVCCDFEVDPELRAGLAELSQHHVHRNFSYLSLLSNPHSPTTTTHPPTRQDDALDLDAIHASSRAMDNARLNRPLNTLVPHLAPPTRLRPEFWWFLQFIKQDNEEEEGTAASAGRFKISTSHASFEPFSNCEPGFLVTLLDSMRLGGRAERFLVTVRYAGRSGGFRALGHILGLTKHRPFSASLSLAHSHSKQQQQASTNAKLRRTLICQRMLAALVQSHETCQFDSLGLMVDCSRNGVLRVIRVKQLCRFIALMGLNVLQLYTEDTYQIKGEPFFGYFRGPYTALELQEIDDYAHALGIEVIPCIQTLGHLGQMLQWPRFGGMRDTHDVLLAGSQEVYGFIEKMIQAITSPLRSKKIHIGMDEAHGVSEGRYRQLFGHKDSCQVFTDHLNRVNQICTKMGLRPMIWSDSKSLSFLSSFFWIDNNSLGGYYDSSSPVTPELVQSIPPEIELIYWDYYHTTPAPYINKINQHRDLNHKSPAMASGIWTWSRFWTALPFSMETIAASMAAIKDPQSGVKHALTTIWGDEGNECDMCVFHIIHRKKEKIKFMKSILPPPFSCSSWSALPGILFYSEHAYSPHKAKIDDEFLKTKFLAICGGSLEDFVLASKLDDLQDENQFVDDKARFTPNLSKWLIWEEPFFSILSPQYAGHDLERHYEVVAGRLEEGMQRGQEEYPMNGRLKLPKLIGKMLALKCHLRERLVLAYANNQRDELLALAGPGPHSRLSRLRALCDETWKYHRDLWMSMYKPFGWEVLELRYGGLRARLESMHERLQGYLESMEDGEGAVRIEELEVQTELVYPSSGAVMMLGKDFSCCLLLLPPAPRCSSHSLSFLPLSYPPRLSSRQSPPILLKTDFSFFSS